MVTKKLSMSTNDVEKRWHDPAALHAAARYVVAVIAAAGIGQILLLLIGHHSPLWALVIPAILLIGGIGAFIKTYRVWRAEGTWPIWHGAGWFLFTLLLVSLSIPGVVSSE